MSVQGEGGGKPPTDDVGIKIDALVQVAQKITNLPDQIGSAVKDAIASSFGNLGDQPKPAEGGEVIPAEPGEGGGSASTTEFTGTLNWGDELTINHNMPATAPAKFASDVAEIVNRILRDAGLLQGAGKPVQEGGITPTPNP